MKYAITLSLVALVAVAALVVDRDNAQAVSIGGEYTYKHYTSANASSTARTIVRGGYGELGRVTINTTPGAVVRLYDAATTTAATSTLDAIAVIKAAAAETTLDYEVSLLKGLTVELPATFTGDITVGVR